MTAQSPLKKVQLLNVSDRQDVFNSLDELSRILGLGEAVSSSASTRELVALHEELSQRLFSMLDA